MEYIELIDHKQRRIDDVKAKEIYNDWIKVLRRKLNSEKCVTIHSRIRNNKRVNDYIFVYNKLLSDLNLDESYILYYKNNGVFGYSIKAKPRTLKYKQKMQKKARLTWDNVHKHMHHQINKNPRSKNIMMKRADDSYLAGWYKSIMESEFVDNLVQIQEVVTNSGVLKYNIIVNCEININLNIK